MNNADAAEILTTRLGLDLAPVALGVRDAAPEACETAKDEAPSACSFWRKAEAGLFFATAEAHLNCPIGAMVMGFERPAEVDQELMQMVEQMTGLDYITGSEPAHLPTHPRPGAKGVLYGPLAAFPGSPDAILVWLTPAQAMLWNEATGDAVWGSATAPLVTGRPACAAIPTSMGEKRPALSLGCAGMRTFTGIGDDRLLAVLPGSAVASFCDALSRIGAANAKMTAMYDERLAAFAAP